ncbi:DUF2993 domain-containing protein [Prochlorococcus sp. MIT 1307]|uniref:LmeA family phospholipid-binding protein n=1 Tax=Prochlorococcus sp. MIT 1307 TaxID=3096219 RepID=UPI002A75F4D6|nr:DUF2993 domain-containing protein [Prochlorococcus sp. MIT 1307]
MSNKPLSKKGPLIQIIESGLEIWVRTQCQSIGKIKIEINASALELLTGRFSGAKIKANDVIFKGLPFYEVSLTSNSLHLQIDLSNKKQKVSLKDIFEVQGRISLESQSLNKIIFSKQWSWIGDWLAKNLLEVTKLEALSIKGNSIEAKSTGKDPVINSNNVEFLEVEANSGTLIFKNKSKDISKLLPMDPSIFIDSATLEDEKLHLTGYSKIKP